MVPGKDFGQYPFDFCTLRFFDISGHFLREVSKTPKKYRKRIFFSTTDWYLDFIVKISCLLNAVLYFISD